MSIIPFLGFRRSCGVVVLWSIPLFRVSHGAACFAVNLQASSKCPGPKKIQLGTTSPPRCPPTPKETPEVDLTAAVIKDRCVEQNSECATASGKNDDVCTTRNTEAAQTTYNIDEYFSGFCKNCGLTKAQFCEKQPEHFSCLDLSSSHPLCLQRAELNAALEKAKAELVEEKATLEKAKLTAPQTAVDKNEAKLTATLPADATLRTVEPEVIPPGGATSCEPPRVLIDKSRDSVLELPLEGTSALELPFDRRTVDGDVTPSRTSFGHRSTDGEEAFTEIDPTDADRAPAPSQPPSEAPSNAFQGRPLGRHPAEHCRGPHPIAGDYRHAGGRTSPDGVG